jgi:hypothetical protein
MGYSCGEQRRSAANDAHSDVDGHYFELGYVWIITGMRLAEQEQEISLPLSWPL